MRLWDFFRLHGPFFSPTPCFIFSSAQVSDWEIENSDLQQLFSSHVNLSMRTRAGPLTCVAAFTHVRHLLGLWFASLIKIPFLLHHSPSLWCNMWCWNAVSLAKAQPETLWFPFQQRKALHYRQICHTTPMNMTQTPMHRKLTFLRLWENWQQQAH